MNSQSSSSFGSVYAALAVALLGGCTRVANNTDSSDLPSEADIDLSVRGNVTCMTNSDHQAKCWGRGTWAQHGQQSTEALGDDEPVTEIPFLSLDAGVEQISASSNTVCALLEDRLSFLCWGGTPLTGAWGYPFEGLLGDDEPIANGTRISVSSSIRTIDTSGVRHTCVLFENAFIKCFGSNYYGELGYGHTDSLCDEPNETVDSLPAVDVGGPVAELALGDGNYSCARLTDGTVRCWGRNAWGILGQGIATSTQIGDDEAPSAYPPIELAGEPVVSLSASPVSVCAVHADGALSCWGSSSVLGYPGVPVTRQTGGEAIGDNETPASVGHVDVGGTVAQVAAGRYHTCVVLTDGGVKCWGAGGLVPLGYGNNDVIGDDESPAMLEPLQLGGPAESVHVGENHTCVVLVSGDVKCWGWPTAACGYGTGGDPIGWNETLENLPALEIQ